jgi:hypothetical protein
MPKSRVIAKNTVFSAWLLAAAIFQNSVVNVF